MFTPTHKRAANICLSQGGCQIHENQQISVQLVEKPPPAFIPFPPNFFSANPIWESEEVSYIFSLSSLNWPATHLDLSRGEFRNQALASMLLQASQARQYSLAIYFYRSSWLPHLDLKKGHMTKAFPTRMSGATRKASMAPNTSWNSSPRVADAEASASGASVAAVVGSILRVARSRGGGGCWRRSQGRLKKKQARAGQMKQSGIFRQKT